MDRRCCIPLSHSPPLPMALLRALLLVSLPLLSSLPISCSQPQNPWYRSAQPSTTEGPAAWRGPWTKPAADQATNQQVEPTTTSPAAEPRPWTSRTGTTDRANTTPYRPARPFVPDASGIPREQPGSEGGPFPGGSTVPGFDESQKRNPWADPEEAAAEAVAAAETTDPVPDEPKAEDVATEGEAADEAPRLPEFEPSALPDTKAGQVTEETLAQPPEPSGDVDSMPEELPPELTGDEMPPEEPVAGEEAPVTDMTEEETQETMPGGVFSNLLPEKLQCLLSDYVRRSGPCGEDGTRLVDYVTIRNCTDPFPIPSKHREPCECTPEDYERTYKEVTKSSFFSSTKSCKETYEPTNCKASGTLSSYDVDPVYCELAGVPCREDHIQVLYQKCDYVRDKSTGKAISDSKAAEVVYYFSSECDPTAKGSVPLPPNSFLPCDLSCGGGFFLNRDKCEKCPVGTFSLGGAIRFDIFDAIDPLFFQTWCVYKVKGELVNCTTGWYAEDGALEVGQFDFINQWYPEECEEDPGRDCHNNLKAVIYMDVDLVRDGYVKFKFTVNSEKGHDGLSFYLDSLEDKPLMGLESYQFEPREVMFRVTTGHHRLFWVYSKDSRFTQGEDIATITFLEVDGLAYNDFHCTQCPRGFFSPGGVRECDVCPPNAVAPNVGSAQCARCGGDEYALNTPRIECLKRKACDMQRDATKVISPCMATTNKRTVAWKWVEPHICAQEALPPDTEEDCGECLPGLSYELDEGTGTLSCKPCRPGTARPHGQLECMPCPEGSAAPHLWTLAHFNERNGTLPTGLETGCIGECGTLGWRPVHDFLDSGAHHGHHAQVWLALNVTMAMAGYVKFNFSVDMSAGDKERGFYFYIDDDLVDFVQNSENGALTEETPRVSGDWELKAGEHRLEWVWTKVSPKPAKGRDSAVIYDIIIKGSAEGAPAVCEEVPAGMQLNEERTALEPCPPGTKNEGGKDKCEQCPANTFSAAEDAGTYCTDCERSTTSNPGSTDCFIGDVNDPGTFCVLTVGADPFTEPTNPGEGEQQAEGQTPGGQEERTPEGTAQEGEGLPEGEQTGDTPEGGQQPSGEETSAPPPEALPTGGAEEGQGAANEEGAAAEGRKQGPEGRMRMEVGVKRATAMTRAEFAKWVVMRGRKQEAPNTGTPLYSHFFYYDLTPLGRRSEHRPFGPIVPRQSKGAAQGPAYYVSVCQRDKRNSTCYDLSGKSLESYACQVPPPEALLNGRRPAINLGRTMGLYPLSEIHKDLGGRGLTILYKGDRCLKTSEASTLNITLICDPQAGYGEPAPWTARGKALAFTPGLAFPHWVDRGGDPLPVENPETCSHELVWYSTSGCPLCTFQDIEEVAVSDCADSVMYKYRWKDGKACQETALPPDIPCRPCDENDYEKEVGSCSDEEGKHNVTYHWLQPRQCSDTMEGAAQLPGPDLAGPCIQTFLLVPSNVLSPKYVFAFALLGVILIVLFVVWIVTWIKHRRIRSHYERLMQADEKALELGDLDGDDGEGAGNEGQRLHDGDD